MHKDRWLDQLAIVERNAAELAEELQEVLAEESMQGSLFGGPQREDINLDSHQQVTQALQRLGIPVPDSTRNWKLQPLAAEYPVIATLLEYRTVQKALTSYGQNMIDLINPSDRSPACGLSPDWRADGKVLVHESKHSAGAACG